MALDENDTRVARVVFQDKKGQDQIGLPAPGTSATGSVVGECSRPLLSRGMFTWLSTEDDVRDTSEEEREPKEALKCTC